MPGECPEHPELALRQRGNVCGEQGAGALVLKRACQVADGLQPDWRLEKTQEELRMSGCLHWKREPSKQEGKKGQWTGCRIDKPKEVKAAAQRPVLPAISSRVLAAWRCGHSLAPATSGGHRPDSGFPCAHTGRRLPGGPTRLLQATGVLFKDSAPLLVSGCCSLLLRAAACVPGTAF